MTHDERTAEGADRRRTAEGAHDVDVLVVGSGFGGSVAAGGSIGEPFGMPLTAHFLGGCAIGASPETGVVDAYQRVFGHPGLHVLDGAAVSANLGVNPSLTITAQAERAVALWPHCGEDDPRPPLGSGYRRVAPVAPRSPLVPADAPAALRLPVVRVTHGGTP
jgi:cholesterol oxidase